MIKIAIIGAGKIVENFHLPAWKKINNARVVGIIDTDILKAKKFAKKNNIFAAKNINQLLKLTNIDAVDICTPNHSHKNIIMKSLRLNLHVICEKPLVTNFNDIDKIISLVKKKKLICMSAQHQRFRKPSTKLKKLIKTKNLGKIFSVHIESISSFSEAIKNKYFYLKKFSGGGPLLDLGSHFIDLILWLFDNPRLLSVSANVSSSHSNYLKSIKKINKKVDIEDYAKGLLKFENNLSVSFEFSYLGNFNFKRKQNIIIHGSKKTVIWPKMEIKRNLKNDYQMKINEKKQASILMMETFVKYINDKNYINQDLQIIKKAIRIIKQLYNSAKIKRKKKFENF